jgi:hypothetical protein
LVIVRVCLAIVFATFVGVAAARADATAGPTLLSVAAQQRHPSAAWTLPAGVGAEAIEVATSPDVSSDGSFLPENTVAYDVLAPNASSWLSARPLALGTFYVHVQSSDDGWSNVMVLTIANTAPRLSGSLRFVGRHAAFVQATITVCDDTDGEPALLISERKWAGSQTFARATSRRRLFFLGNCRRFTVRWRLASRFYGVGHYTVRLQIRDDDGALSNVVARSWFTGD